MIIQTWKSTAYFLSHEYALDFNNLAAAGYNYSIKLSLFYLALLGAAPVL